MTTLLIPSQLSGEYHLTSSITRKQYFAELKREAVRLADDSKKGDSAVERELGLYQDMAQGRGILLALRESDYANPDKPTLANGLKLSCLSCRGTLS